MEKKRRAESYFGLHFDFHADKTCTHIGTATTAADIGKLLDTVKPDFVQVDTKGHPGLASYRSRFAPNAPGLETDHLKIIREETEKRGIALYAHHSGLFDQAACATHPDWAALGQDGKPDPVATDVMGPYVDRELIPCLEELAQDYGFDGAWVDGEEWALKPSFKPEELEEFYRVSGFDHVDTDRLSPSYLAFVAFWKEKFRAYLRHYLNTVHADCPGFQMTSNFSFSQQMPEKPIDEIDFLSGDNSGVEGRVCVRCYAGLGKPWDSMSYGQSGMYINPDGGFSPYSTKHIDRMRRDAAMSIAQGGGYQIFNNMTREGQIRLYDLNRLKTIADFVYARKPWCFHARPHCSVAVLHSAYNAERRHLKEFEWPQLYGPSGNGMCDVVLDGGLPCDIIYEYRLEDPLHRTLIVPDSVHFLSAELKGQLRRFAENGGNLIVCGRESCKLLADLVEADVRDFDGNTVYASAVGGMFGTHDAVTFENHGADDLIDCYLALTDTAPKVSLIVTNPCGKGRVVFVGFDMMEEYRKYRYFELPDLMRRILLTVDPAQDAYLESGIRKVELVPTEKDGLHMVNVMNTTEYGYDEAGAAAGEIPPIYDLTVAVRCDAAPKSVMLEPEHRPAAYTYDGAFLHVKIDRLHIHTVIVIDPA